MTNKDLIKQNTGRFYLPRKLKKKWKKFLFKYASKDTENLEVYCIVPYLINPKYSRTFNYTTYI